MRISDWSSDVCSSDLPGAGTASQNNALHAVFTLSLSWYAAVVTAAITASACSVLMPGQIGRVSVVRAMASATGKAARTSVVSGQGVAVRVDLGGGRIITHIKNTQHIRAYLSNP